MLSRFHILLTLLILSTHSPLAASFYTTVTVDLTKPIGSISPHIYGQYLEHVQAEEQTIYPSLWDANHAAADSTGVRTDVASQVKALSVPIVRWPGGCFADVYHWEDAIGPRSERQPKPNLHWGGMESNQFGTDEFLHWCSLTGAEPYINVNLGSGTLDEALRWLEYTNASSDSAQGKRRARNGHPAPHNVKYWGIGNETWGEWETGHTDAATYGTSLSLWARAMRTEDPSIQILGVGSEEGNDVAWDSTVLAKAGADIDYLTVHMYGINTVYDGSEYEAVAFTPSYLESRFSKVLKTIDEATSGARDTPIKVSVDEWNIRHFYQGKQNRKSERTLQDALFTAGFLNAMLRHSPRVAMANYVFLVNGNATLLVDQDQVVWTPLAHLFQQYRRWMKGTAVTVETTGPAIVPPTPLTAHPGRLPPKDFVPSPQPYVDASAAVHSDGSLAVSITNRHKTESAKVVFNVPAGYAITESWTLHHEDIYAKNTFSRPDEVTPAFTKEKVGHSQWPCPAHSITLLLFTKPAGV